MLFDAEADPPRSERAVQPGHVVQDDQLAVHDLSNGTTTHRTTSRPLAQHRGPSSDITASCTTSGPSSDTTTSQMTSKSLKRPLERHHDLSQTTSQTTSRPLERYHDLSNDIDNSPNGRHYDPSSDITALLTTSRPIERHYDFGDDITLYLGFLYCFRSQYDIAFDV